jgi:hypothetical protein
MTDTATPPVQGSPDRRAIRPLRTSLSRFGIFLLLPVLLVLGGAISPAFLGASNISNLLADRAARHRRDRPVFRQRLCAGLIFRSPR